MAKQKRVAMGRDDLESGGFLNDKACRIDEAEATSGTSKSGKGGERSVVRLLMTVEDMDEQVERNLSVGKGLLPLDDGTGFTPDEDAEKPAKGIKKSSNYGRFLESLYEADSDGKINVQDITTDLPGIVFRALEVEEPAITEGDPPRRVLTVAEILDEMPKGTAKGKKAKPKVEDEEEEETEEDEEEEEAEPVGKATVKAKASSIIKNLLGKKSPRDLDELPALVLRAAAGDKDRKAIVALSQDAKFLATVGTVNAKKGTIAEEEE